jgi:ribose 5-phosphate isomerase RpiB
MSRPLVTVKTLLAQVRDGAPLTLPADAIITPAARDWLQTARVTVETSDAPPPVKPKGPTRYVIGDPACPTVATLLPQLERAHAKLDFRSCQGRLDCCLQHLCAVCQGLAECDQRRGVVLVAEGSVVSAVANRHPQVRAAVVQRPSALAAIMQCLGPNLLVVETSQLAVRQVVALMNDFFDARPRVEPCVAAALEQQCAALDGKACFCQWCHL